MRLRWLGAKALGALLTLVFVLVFNFFLFRVMGDPTAQLARLPRAGPEEIEKLRAVLRARQVAGSGSSPTTRATPCASTSASASARAATSRPS